MVLSATALIPTPNLKVRANTIVRFFDRDRQPRQALELFSGIGDWPDIDERLADRSVQLITQHGVKEWSLAGGIVRPDGRPSFGSPSALAYREVRNIIRTSDGLRYSDDAGTQWAVIIPNTYQRNQGTRQGLAIGMDFPIALLDRKWRHRCLSATQARLSDLIRPGRVLDDVSQSERGHLSVVHHRLQLIDTAIKAVPVLYTAAKTRGRNKVCVDSRHLAAAAWGVEAWWPENCINIIFEAVAMLGTFRVQTLNLPKTGWDPQSHNRRAVVSNVEWRDSHFLNIQMAPNFIDFVTHWLANSRWESSPISSLVETVCPH